MSSDQCEFCGRAVAESPVSKVIRGTRHVFCCEGCFVLWRYDRPKFDPAVVYDRYTLSVTLPPGDDLPKE